MVRDVRGEGVLAFPIHFTPSHIWKPLALIHEYMYPDAIVLVKLASRRRLYANAGLKRLPLDQCSRHHPGIY